MLFPRLLNKFSGKMDNNISLIPIRYLSKEGFNKRRNTLSPMALRGKKTSVSKLFSPFRSSSISQHSNYHTIIKPLAFTVCFSGGVFVCSAIWQYEELRRKVKRYRNQFQWLGQPEPPSKNFISKEISTWWNSKTEGQKVATVIIALNSLVFLMWKVPSLQPFMIKYFQSSPTMRGNCWPMVLSTFSHYNFFHILANMYVLHSFSTSAVAFFGKEQFVALYLSAGAISSFTSYLGKVLSKSPGPSIGASGALMAILSSVCLQFPQTQLTLVFFPFFTVSAGKAIKVLMAVDFVGILAKWKFFDHAAHLGGAVFGVFYLYKGKDYIWGKREKLIKWWHNLREKIK